MSDFLKSQGSRADEGPGGARVQHIGSEGGERRCVRAGEAASRTEARKLARSARQLERAGQAVARRRTGQHGTGIQHQPVHAGHEVHRGPPGASAQGPGHAHGPPADRKASGDRVSALEQPGGARGEDDRAETTHAIDGAGGRPGKQRQATPSAGQTPEEGRARLGQKHVAGRRETDRGPTGPLHEPIVDHGHRCGPLGQIPTPPSIRAYPVVAEPLVITPPPVSTTP